MLASSFLRISKMVERRIWDFQSPLYQFADLSQDVLRKIDKAKLSIEEILEESAEEIGLIFLFHSTL